MSQILRKSCRWCQQTFAGGRKYCSRECRRLAQESRISDPTPEQIREICRQIREEGGAAWERSHTCYAPQPVRVPVVTVSRYCSCAIDG